MLHRMVSILVSLRITGKIFNQSIVVVKERRIVIIICVSRYCKSGRVIMNIPKLSCLLAK